MPSRLPALKLLLLSYDLDLLEAISALAAAVGLEVEVRANVIEPGWTDAALVLVGADVLSAIAQAVPARRQGVIVVANSNDDRVWRPALELGAEHVAFLPNATAWLTERFAAAVEGPGATGT